MDSIPVGYCQCGCGGKTNRSQKNQNGLKKGDYCRFILGHNRPGNPPGARWFLVEERGFTSPCWIWQGATNGVGYATIRHRKTFYVHRGAYEALVGPIPDGRQLHHLCHQPGCINPDHLIPVTPAQHRWLDIYHHWESPWCKNCGEPVRRYIKGMCKPCYFRDWGKNRSRKKINQVASTPPLC